MAETFNLLAGLKGPGITITGSASIDLSDLALAVAEGIAEQASENLPGKTPGGDTLPITKDGEGTPPRGKVTGRFAKSWKARKTASGAEAVADPEPGQAERVYGDADLFSQRGIDQPRVKAALQRAADRAVKGK